MRISNTVRPPNLLFILLIFSVCISAWPSVPQASLEPAGNDNQTDNHGDRRFANVNQRASGNTGLTGLGWTEDIDWGDKKEPGDDDKDDGEEDDDEGDEGEDEV